MNRYIFIVGAEKCGTTSIAEYLVSNKLAIYLQPNVKESHPTAGFDPFPFRLPRMAQSTYVDASVSVSLNREHLARIPAHESKILFSLRNQFERTWSAFKMMKYMSLEPEWFKHTDAPTGISNRGMAPFDFVLRSYDIKRRNELITYQKKELGLIATQTFKERIDYEIGFFLSRRVWPFFSILQSSFYGFSYSNIYSKFIPEQIFTCTLDTLQENGAYSFMRFALDGSFDEISKFPHKFKSMIEDDQIEPKPNFQGIEYDQIRYFFNSDLSKFSDDIKKSQINPEWINFAELTRNIK